jgi:nicotinamidase/pyrazinamidase
MHDPMEALEKGDALILVDVQKDFCPGGALAIEEGDKILSVLNGWVEAAQKKDVLVYASRDWHPIRHVSFKEQGGKWPPHCIQDSDGAKFHADLILPDTVVKVTKGVRFDQDQNSVFDQTGLAVQFEREGVRRLWIGGLALDVCVLASVLDARRAGFEVRLLQKATRPVTEEGGREALQKMIKAGAEIEER